MAALLSGQEVPFIEVTKDGTTYRLPVQQQELRGGEYRPMPVARSPKLAFPPPIAIAGPEGGQFRRNYDVDELVQVTWDGGMGEDTHAANTEVRTYQWGRAATHWPNILTNRPASAQLGGDIATLASDVPVRVVELGYTNAELLAYTFWTNVAAQRWTGAAWTAIQAGGVNVTQVRGHALGLNGVALSGLNPASGIYRSPDGVTWESVALGALTNVGPICAFDEKMWAVTAVAVGGATSRLVLTAYSSADFYSAAAGAVTWTAGATLTIPFSVWPNKLFTWMYPLDRGKQTLWLLTGAALYYYDYYAATPAWREWFVFQSPQQAGNDYQADAAVAQGNLYVGIYGQEWVWEFTGNTIARPSWNKRHGLPDGTRLTPRQLGVSNDRLYVFCAPHPADAASLGAVVHMDEGQQFHHLYDHPTKPIYGGGVGLEAIWPVVADGTAAEVWELGNPDILAVPPNVTGRSFDTAANPIQSGWLRMGLANTNKRKLYTELDCIKNDGTNGLNPGATVQWEYRGRGSASWTSAGTLTDASTFPAVLAIPGGWTFKEMQYRLTLTAGSSGNPALVRALKIGYRPRPKQRYTYQARVDLRDGSPAFAGADGRFWGRSASSLRGILDELSDSDDAGADDTLVALAYGGHGNLLHPRRRSASQCEVSIQAQEAADGGDGLYLLLFSDVSAPSSG
jgi:hypothetical protein